MVVDQPMSDIFPVPLAWVGVKLVASPQALAAKVFKQFYTVLTILAM